MIARVLQAIKDCTPNELWKITVEKNTPLRKHRENNSVEYSDRKDSLIAVEGERDSEFFSSPIRISLVVLR